MNLIFVIEIYKSMFPVKNDTNNINILYTGSSKIFCFTPTYEEDIFKAYFKIFILHGIY